MKNKFFVIEQEVLIKLKSPPNISEILWTIIDTSNFERINNETKNYWYSRTSERSRTFYAVIRDSNGNQICMHNIILPHSNKVITDHKNRNGLDNRKNNLRLVNKSINSINTNVRKSNYSGITGVCWDNFRKRWLSYININGKRIDLGRFRKKEDAIEARSKAEDAYV